MSLILNLLESGDVCSLGFLIALLAAVGTHMTGNRPELRIYSSRLAAGAFLLYCIYGGIKFRPCDVEELIWLVFRAILAGGLCLSVSLICLPAGTFLRQLLVKATTKIIHKRTSDRKCSIDTTSEQRQQKEAECRQRQQAEWERLAPERERQQIEQQQAEQKRQADQYGREAIRLNCQLLYDQHAQKLQSHFPRERLKEYFQQYLSDDFPLDIVRQRGQLLHEMLHASLEQAGGKKQKFSNLHEIAAHFQERKKEVESLDYDEPTRQSFLSSLNLQEDHAIREFLSQ